MCFVYFRNAAKAGREFAPDRPWEVVRYDVERWIGMSEEKESTECVFGYLEGDDFAAKVPLGPGYTLRAGDRVMVVRAIVPKQPLYVPEEVLTAQKLEAAGYNRLIEHIRRETDEAKRMKLVMEQQRMRSAVEDHPHRHRYRAHPSHKVALRKCAAYRTAPGVTERIYPPQPPRGYTCPSCCNYLGPPHLLEDCEYEPENRRRWLSRRPQPHGVMSTRKYEITEVRGPEDLDKVTWVDHQGRLLGDTRTR